MVQVFPLESHYTIWQADHHSPKTLLLARIFCFKYRSWTDKNIYTTHLLVMPNKPLVNLLAVLMLYHC